MRVLFNVVQSQVGWFALVLSAAAGQAWIGIAVAAALLLLHVLRVAQPTVELAVVGVAAAVGAIVDTVLLQLDLLRFASSGIAGVAPLWMIALWMVFATTLRHSLAWLQSRPVLAAAIGAAAGPLAYAAGARLGAVEVPNVARGYAAIGLSWSIALPALLLFALTGCQSARAPMKPVEHVDLQRFMGDWYVIACIPTFIERNAHNAVESYRLQPDGRIATTFTFRQRAFDGPPKRYTPTGYVRDASGAVWGMQFVWPIKADYRIIYLDQAYQQTVIGRQKRDHVWIMAREPQIPPEDYRRHLAFLREQGYDTSKVRLVPQQPLQERADVAAR